MGYLGVSAFLPDVTRLVSPVSRSALPLGQNVGELWVQVEGRMTLRFPDAARLTICPLQPEADVYVALGLRARLICVGGRR